MSDAFIALHNRYRRLKDKITKEEADNYDKLFKRIDSLNEQVIKQEAENEKLRELVDLLWENEPDKTEMLDNIQKYLLSKGGE